MFSWLLGLFFSKNREFSLLEEVFEECINKTTYVVGFPGTGKTTLLEQLTDRIYKQNKSYILCGNSINDLNQHFRKHKTEDNVLVFVLEDINTHSIDVDYLFSLDNFLNYVCFSEEKKIELKEKNIRWLSLFEDESNKSFFKENMFDLLLDLIKHGYIEEKGNIDKELIKDQVYIYCALGEKAKFKYAEDEKIKYLHLLNFIQFSMEKEINVIFDEERIFFKSHKNDCDKIIILKELNNKYILTAQLLFKLTDEQLICFKSMFQATELGVDKYHQNEIRALGVGEFYFFKKKGEFFSEKKIKLVFEELKKEEMDIQHFFNDKRKKLHDLLQKDLDNIKELIKKKPHKI